MKRKIKISIKEFVRQRDEAVASLSISEFKKFHKRMVELGVYRAGTLPSDEILKIAIRKMACESTNIPLDVKLKASEWLLERGFSPCINDYSEVLNDN